MLSFSLFHLSGDLAAIRFFEDTGSWFNLSDDQGITWECLDPGI